MRVSNNSETVTIIVVEFNIAFHNSETVTIINVEFGKKIIK